MPVESVGVSMGHFDLGFRGSEDPDISAALPNTEGERPPLMLGPRKSTLVWEVSAWLAVAGGIFCRQGLDLPSLVWRLSNISVGTAVASLVVALAVFPMMMRWINRRRRRASLEHIAAPFAFGFFLDLAMLALVKVPATFTSRV
jgi:hypothetical protein